MQRDSEFLATEKPSKLLLKLALPAVTAQLVNMLYNIVDRMYIGRLEGIGTEALAGVGACMPVILLVSAFAALASMGGAPRASIFMGQGDQESAERTMGNCMTLLLFLAAVLTAALLIFQRPILLTFGALPETLPKRALPKMAALAGPPLALRVTRQASSRNTLAILVFSSSAPNRMNT